MQTDYPKVAGLVLVCVSIPTFIAVFILDTIPTATHLILLALIAIASIHPTLGIPNIAELLGLQEPVELPQSQERNDKEVPMKISDKPDTYIKEYEPLKNELIALADLEKEKCGPGDDCVWKEVLHQEKELFNISVQKRKDVDFFFRIVVDFEGTPEETFDLVADISKRPNWDEICQSAGIIERISNKTAIQFMRTKGIWPTSPREAIIMSFTDKLEDGRYINVTKSIDSHEDYKSVDGDVRMIATIAGLVIGPHPSNNPKICRCVQIVNGDLGGWLPPSVVSLVTTQAFPISMRRANKQLKKIPNHKTVSNLIEQAQGNATIEKVAPKKVEVAKDSIVVILLKKLRESQPLMVLAILFIILFKKR
ncbi:hypothetical protein BC833DRAFT_571767 [Globomyces pollinis-pini]|nr:hypothetical protein BC833DRAFT_571767 [Globomyces pollinis-pini]